MATYVNNLRLTEITTGDESGTWGTTTNSNWDFATDAFGHGVKNMAGDANETFTMADGSVDTLRSMYLKITSTVAPLTATRTLTIAPNTVSKVWIIENNAAGSQSISIKQGSGAEITIATGTRAMVYTDGAGAGAAVFLASPTISTLAGTVPVANGGTSLTTLTANNVILGNGASAPTFVAPSTSGNVLTSNGTTWSSTAPATSGTVTSVAATVPTLLSVSGSPITSSGTLAFTYSGTALPTANGGTGQTSNFTQYGVVYAPTTTTLGNTGAGTTTTVLHGNVGGAPTYAAVALAADVSGVLPADNGGTGVANNAAMTVTGSGNFAYTRTLTAATNVTFPTTGTLATLGGVETFTGTKTFSGSTSTLAEVLSNAGEVATVSATAATGTINYDVTTQSVIYYTTNASANWTVNFRASSGTSLNTAMSTGQSVTVAFLVSQGATAYYNSAVQVDGNSVTPKYQGGTAWAAGNASSIDVYMYTIIKTGNAAFTVFTSQTKFA